MWGCRCKDFHISYSKYGINLRLLILACLYFTLHILQYLINMIGSVDMDLAHAAADVVYNIRMLAMAAERVRLR